MQHFVTSDILVERSSIKNALKNLGYDVTLVKGEQNNFKVTNAP